jgi:hypothetical protein
MGQGITMQAVIGETVKPQEFRVDQIRDVSTAIFPDRAARPTLIGGCAGNTAFSALRTGAGAGPA